MRFCTFIQVVKEYRLFISHLIVLTVFTGSDWHVRLELKGTEGRGRGVLEEEASYFRIIIIIIIKNIEFDIFAQLCFCKP